MNIDDNWLGLASKVCTVSGAGGGIGRAIASALARQGARVAILDRNRISADETAEMIEKEGGEAVAVEADISDQGSIAGAISEIESKLGKSSVLVNNAALVRNGALADLSLADWNAVINVNLTGFFLMSQAFGARMREFGGGSIVHVASLSGSLPQPTSGAYSVSKAGVLMLSRNLALEWGQYGIRSNVVSPAMVVTPMTEMIYQDPDIRARREGVVPLRRIGLPDDTANAVCFLASERSGYVSAQEIIVDGGWSSGMLAMVPRPGFDQPKKD